VAKITNVSFSGAPDQQTVSIAADDHSAFLAATGGNTIDSGTVTVATITVVGDTVGSSVLDPEVTSLETEAGVDYNITETTNASLSVVSETTRPRIHTATATGFNDDGVVVDGEEVTVAVNATDAESGVESVVTDATALGAGSIALTDDDGDGRYNGTFVVDESATAQPGDTYQIPITATDNAGNANETVAGPLKLESLHTEVSIVPARQRVTATNTTTFDIVVANATGGVGAWALSVTQPDADAATIRDVSLEGAPEQQTIAIAPDNDSVSIEAAGANTTDAGRVTIATITVAGENVGDSVHDLDVTSLGTETGFDYNVTGATTAQLTTTPPAVRSDYTGPPTDVDDDGQFEDVNGNGNFTMVDIQAFYASRERAAIQSYPASYNYNSIGDVDIVDVQRLYYELQQREQASESE
jgi:hypothetical protein